MEIKAQVHNIAKLKDYYFVVPDYQREYVWKVDDQVEQFLVDIANEFEPGAKVQSSYFIGSVIIVKNEDRYDVIDGQQRLTTIVLTMCALRDLLKDQARDERQEQYFQNIQGWLSSFDVESGEVKLRLELQYEESKDFLSRLIQKQPPAGDNTASIAKMREAYERIKANLAQYLQNGLNALTEYTRYFLSKIDLVVIESENLSSALKIFETINQRGAGLNAMDLVKNLLFSQAKGTEFSKIKEKWKELTAHLQRAGEEENPLRFLRYYLMARHHHGILREDDIYKWIISPDGKEALAYELKPYELAVELTRAASRYADLVTATELQEDGGAYPSVTRIGFINKYRSRQHLILLLAISDTCGVSEVNYLADQIESFYFYSNTLGIQAKYNERLFAQWASNLRGLRDKEAITAAVNLTLLPYLQERLAQFKQTFMTLRHSAFDPLYRLRYVLGRIENTVLSQANAPLKGLSTINAFQLEHIFPQTPKDGVIPVLCAPNADAYTAHVYRLGNVTLLESSINQAVNNFNDLSGTWFAQKQGEYAKSSVETTKLLNHGYGIGQNTAINRIKTDLDHVFRLWDTDAVNKRQGILMELALETWRIGGKRIDKQATATTPTSAVAVVTGS